jgi:hypothetical protein
VESAPRMDRVTPLLAQFPGPLMLRPSKRKWVVMLVAAGLFTVGGVGEAVSSNSSNMSNWIGAVFFGLCTVGFVYVIFFAGFEMTLDGDGFSWRGGRLSEQWQWTDVRDFAVVEYAPGAPGAALRKGVGFSDMLLNKSKSQKAGALITGAMTGRDCVVVPDAFSSSSFGLPMADLACLMSEWQNRAVALRAAPGGKPSRR